MSAIFAEDWAGPFRVPPFARINSSDYAPAFTEAFNEHIAEIEAIVANPDAPSFANTVVAFERSGAMLQRLSAVFFNLASADTSEDLQAIETDVTPRLAAHESRIFTDQRLFARFLAVRVQGGVSGEDLYLLDEFMTRFERAGAGLAPDARQQVTKIDEELAALTTAFSQNILHDTNRYELMLSEADLDGLPEGVREMGAEEAARRGKAGYVYTISRSMITPFLQFSRRRDLREKIYRAYVSCAGNGDASDNRRNAVEIARLRRERAALLGYESHAAYMLADRMAENSTNVRALLDQLWAPASLRVRREAAALQDRIAADGSNFKLEPWDWWYYTEKVRLDEYDMDETVIKPYFELGRVRDGAFAVAFKLYGIRFEPRPEIEGYHPDVEAFEVLEADGASIGIFLTDYFMRPSKRGGAWMAEYVSQSNLDARQPVVVNCCNFPKAAPTLLGLDEVRTLFHEFGHALHGLLSNVTYTSLSGTNVKQDFVELPSQIMEHWAFEPEVLKDYAGHVETGAPIPDELIQKLRAADTFNQGFATTEYLAASYLDLAWHEADETAEVADVERRALTDIGLVPEVSPRYHSSYFQHIFAGESYSAGYYSYIWAEVLDADGFEAFREKGLFDRETAAAFRTHVLERGGTGNPAELYRQFRGRDAEVGPLLRVRGLNN